ncbi:MAG: helix-hairpin-helix domain-containing protein [Planctomycetota bacterium]
MANDQVALRLEEVADLLQAQDANPFRVRAYRAAAETVRGLSRPVHDILAADGPPGLQRLAGIGESLARSIEQLVQAGRLGLLDRLRGTSVEDVLATVPGIGPRLAGRIHDELGIDSLAELEAAAYDGRLARVEGLGRGRVQMIRESLAGRLRRPRPEGPRRRESAGEVSVSELLDVDREYRRKAETGGLARIAPRKFNPTGAAWLPVLHTQREGRHYTALFSNTARAHELGATRDWVIIERDDDGGRGQWTVVTARMGAVAGRRVVRGRESECKTLYETRGPEGRPPSGAQGSLFENG